MPEEHRDLGSELVDLTDVPLAELSHLPQGALARSLRRVIEEADEAQDVIAGFQSAL